MIHLPSIFFRVSNPFLKYRKTVWLSCAVMLMIFLLSGLFLEQGSRARSIVSTISLLLFIQAFLAGLFLETYRRQRSQNKLDSSYFFHEVNEWCMGIFAPGVCFIILLLEISLLLGG